MSRAPARRPKAAFRSAPAATQLRSGTPARRRVRRSLNRAADSGSGATAPASPKAESQIADLGAGAPLPDSERAFFEPRFGADFSAVRFHTGSQAAAAAKSVSARAFARGPDVVFGSGEYRPGSREGRRLIAHELTHTLQQGAVQQGSVQQGAGTQGAVQRQAVSEAGGQQQGVHQQGVQQQDVQWQDAAASEAGLESPEIAAGGGLEHRLQRQEGEEEEPPQGGDLLTLHPSCTGHEAEIRAAWNEALDAVEMTVGMLRRAQSLASERGGVRGTSCGMAERIRAAFGDYDGYNQAISVDFHLSQLIGDYSQLLSVLQQGAKTARCDAEAVLTQIGRSGFCELHQAFVIEELAGFENDIFFCPGFFGSSENPCGALRNRANAIVHELAHNVLGAGHAGGTFPQYGCTPLGLSFDEARDNSYAYDHLATCCGSTGECDEEAVGPERVDVEQSSGDSRGSVSLSGGVAVQDGEVRGALALGTQVGLRSGQALIFQPTFGFHLLTTFDGAGDDVLGAALADFGFRLQQPLEGVYFDLVAGGYTGFRVQPDPVTGDRDTDFSAGLQGGGGLGYRWERVELGAEARGLIPLTSDPAQLLVLGRAALRF
ncbi:MAG: DUF4157 domain-containing protein [Acidobacteriota bacterium]